MRITLSLTALIATFLFALSPAHADFTVFSQNTLHLGYSNKKVTGYVANKYNYLNKNLAERYDVVLYQEVMRKADPNEFKSGNIIFSPASATAGSWFGLLKGFNRYKEAYMATLDSSKVTIYCRLELTNSMLSSYGVSLIRPPDAYLVKSSSGTKYTWLMNFHAIFGGGYQPRLNEAETLKDWIDAKLLVEDVDVLSSACPTGVGKVDRLVIGGDWNLDKAKLETVFTSPYEVSTASQTSLTQDGSLSSNYDHFVSINVDYATAPAVFDPTDSSLPVQQGNCSVSTGGTYCWFRENVSDHLGVFASVKD